MMNWLYYLAEANIYLGVFYLAYCLFLTKETYYQLNRAYLLFSCVAAFVLPVLQVGVLKPVQEAVVTTVNYTVPFKTAGNITQIAGTTPASVDQFPTLQDYLWYVYITGAVILLLMLIVKLYTLFKLIRDKQRIEQDKHKLVYLPESDVAFSFFNYLFIGTNANGANTIIKHELVHINQKHSADILFLELLKIISWFNPCIYLIQNSLKTVHEYIADEQTAAYEMNTLAYSSFLVNNAYGAGGSSITHSFFNYNLLKKRIIMLNKQRSGNLARLKYLLPLPICAALLCASTLAYSKTYGWIDLAPAVPINQLLITPQPQDPPKPKVEQVKFPEPKVVQVKFPPPVVTNINNTLLVVNGKSFEGSYGGVRPGKGGNISFISANNASAIKKWGKRAKNGVTVVTGNNVVIVPPKPKVSQVRFPPPIVRPDTISEYFYKQIANAVRYPKVDRDNNITGKVFASFAVDANDNIQYIKIMRTPSNTLGEEVLRTLKGLTYKGIFKPYQNYVVPLEFSIAADDDNQPAQVIPQVNSQEKSAELVYNPKSVTISTEGSLMLKMVVIRGYATRH